MLQNNTDSRTRNFPYCSTDLVIIPSSLIALLLLSFCSVALHSVISNVNRDCRSDSKISVKYREPHIRLIIGKNILVFVTDILKEEEKLSVSQERESVINYKQ